MKVLDTNYLIRFFTKDIKDQAQKAKQVIKNHKTYIPNIVLAETVYILENHYQASKEKICEGLQGLLKNKNTKSSKHSPLALEIYLNEKISFYDSLIVAETIKRKDQISSFDQKLIKVWKKYR